MKSARMATPLDMIEAHLTWMRAGTYAIGSTVHDAGKLLHRLHRELPAGLHQATGDELADWLDTDGWSASTKATYRKHIVRFYRWATASRDPWMSFDPSTELRRPTVKPGLPRPALHDVVVAATLTLRDPWRLVCRLVALAGLRPCEVATLTRADVTEHVITVVGKGGRTRAVPTHPLIWELVESMPPGRLILGPKRRPVTAHYVSRQGSYNLRRAGLGTPLYPLRHYFGTEVQRKFKDIRVTQDLMGHASPVTTAGYTHVTSEQKREAVLMLFSDAGTAAGSAPVVSESAGAAPQPRPQAVVSGRGVAGRGRRLRLARRARP